jgi:hypothetical protein
MESLVKPQRRKGAKSMKINIKYYEYPQCAQKVIPSACLFGRQGVEEY